MNIQTLKIVSYNGHVLNDETYEASIPIDVPPQAEAGIASVGRAGTWPVYSGLTLDGRTLPITISRKDSGAIGSIVEWFMTHRDAQYPLVVKDITDNSQWYVMAKVKSTPKLKHSVLTVLFYIDDPIWRSVTALEEAWNITATGQTHDFVVGGNEFSMPIFRVGPTSARTGGYGYVRYVAVANRAALLYNDSYNLRDGDWDTAALVALSKMQGDGDDVKIIHDPSGQEVYRWFGGGGINTTTTRPIVNISLPPMISLTLGTLIAASGSIATITVKNTPANKTALGLLAKETYKVIAIDLGGANQEIFTFTGVNVNSLQITGVTRAQKNSAEKSHAVDAMIRHVIGYWVMYGNPSAIAPTTDDGFKPMYTLSSFTNTSRVLAEFYDPANPGRLGQFAPKVLKGTEAQAEIYTANHYTDADVASEMGMALKAYQLGAAWKSPAGSLAWVSYHPAGIKTVTIGNGEKYRAAAGFPSIAALKKSANGKTFSLVGNEASPASAAAWTATTVLTGAKSLGGTYRHVRFEFTGGGVAAGVANNYSAIEFDDLTLELDSNNTPLVWWGDEVSNNYEEFVITNETTDQWLSIAYPVPVDKVIIIDTEHLECYREDDNSPIPIKLDDESRAEWLPWSPGVINRLRYDETGANALTINVEWEDRNL